MNLRLDEMHRSERCSIAGVLLIGSNNGYLADLGHGAGKFMKAHRVDPVIVGYKNVHLDDGTLTSLRRLEWKEDRK
jgi:hypothetical protein